MFIGLSLAITNVSSLSLPVNLRATDSSEEEVVYEVNGLSPVLIMDFGNNVFKFNACGQYSVNGLLPVLAIDSENNLQNPCGQYEVNGLSPVLVADFAQGQYYQKDCAA